MSVDNLEGTLSQRAEAAVKALDTDQSAETLRKLGRVIVQLARDVERLKVGSAGSSQATVGAAEGPKTM